jgi:hypothetical protein
MFGLVFMTAVLVMPQTDGQLHEIWRVEKIMQKEACAQMAQLSYSNARAAIVVTCRPWVAQPEH